MPSSTARMFLAAFLCSACAPLAAQDGVPRILISRQLHEQEVSLVRVERDRVLYRDHLGMLRGEPVDRLVAITMRADDEGFRPPRVEPALGAALPHATLELTDGRRFIGRHISLAAEVPPDDRVRWSHPILGALEFRLDDVQRLILDAAAFPADAQGATGDVVILRNGDRLEGFLGGLGSAVQLEIGEQVRELPLERLAGIILANPPQPRSGGLVYLRDGSIVGIAGLAAAVDGHIAVVPRSGEGPPGDRSESASIPLPLVEVAAIVFDATALVPLAGLEIVRQEPASGRRWVPPLRHGEPRRALLAAPDIEFPGPMMAEWVLPGNAAYFAAEAHLPRTMWNWGDCELIVSLIAGNGGQAETVHEVFRSRLTADAPSAAIRLHLSGVAQQRGFRGPARLRIRVEPGMYGPIQDHIVLKRPLLLLESPPG